MNEALEMDIAGDHKIIDMDAVADAAVDATGNQKSAFCYAEISQQNKFTCSACGEFNDILGTFGYCTVCGTRNDLQELTGRILPSLRDRINAGGAYEGCVRDAVAIFDSFVGRYVKLLLELVPLMSSRRKRLENKRFHNLRSVDTGLKEIFGIDILDGLSSDDIGFAERMFHRRHIYEHRGGEADEEYITNSGDNAVRPKQALHETVESAHRIVGVVQKMASNLHGAFHEIFPPEQRPIEGHRRNQELAKQRRSGR